MSPFPRGGARVGAAVLPLLVVAAFAGAPPPAATHGAGRDPRPDLVVSVELHREHRLDGWLVRVRVDLRNEGARPAPPSEVGIWCRATEGGPCPALEGSYDVGPPVTPGSTGVARFPAPSLPPGGSAFVFGPRTRPWPSGSYVLGAAADVCSSVEESAEGNNSATAAVRIP